MIHPVSIPVAEALEGRALLSGVGFATAVYPGRESVGFAVADFNRDAAPDVAVVTTRGKLFSILLNEGNGALVTANQTRIKNGVAVAAGDFNGDGAGDAAVLFDNYHSPRTIKVFLGDGRGALMPMRAFRIRNGTPTLTAADLNDDGRADLLATGKNGVLVMLSQGDGTFAPPVAYPVGWRHEPWCVRVADLNGDGVSDLVVASMRSGFKHAPATGFLSTLMGQADSTGKATGTFGPPIVTEAVPQTVEATVGDFNGDGRPDVATVNWGGGNVMLWTGNGDGTFAKGATIVAHRWEAVAADFTGDGRTDLAVDGIPLFAGNGDGTLSATQTTVPPISYPVAADMNGDGTPDLVGLGGGVMTLMNLGDASPPSTSSVGGTVFNDGDRNGLLDAGEARQAGMRVFVDSNRNGRLDANEPVAITNDLGRYRFNDLAGGLTVIRQVPAPGFRATAPAQRLYRLFIEPGMHVGVLDFGNRAVRRPSRGR